MNFRSYLYTGLSVDRIQLQEGEREQATESSGNTFLFCLYRYLKDPDQGENPKHLSKSAYFFQKAMGERGFYRRAAESIKLLRKEDERAWAHLLVSLGPNHYMFDLFRDISPFSGKLTMCYTIDFRSGINPLYISSLNQVWQEADGPLSELDKILVVADSSSGIQLFQFRKNE